MAIANHDINSPYPDIKSAATPHSNPPMVYAGIVRRIDDLGRIVIPKEFRDAYKLAPGTPMEIRLTTDGGVFLSPHRDLCVFCHANAMEATTDYKGKAICESCFHDLTHR